MSLKILGMRGLKSKGILPIKKAYMKIDLNMFKNQGEKNTLKRVYKTEPKESGPNPNLSTVVTY